MFKLIKKIKAENEINAIKKECKNNCDNLRFKMALVDTLHYMYSDNVGDSMIKNNFTQLCAFLDVGVYTFIHLEVEVYLHSDGSKSARIIREEKL
ncbi:hypothetical protein HWD03_gp106 [Alteromonas phage vB_AmeM_PT11-V22]|uniref:Uncharacterized protein n=1 Tax=Alteromonas phage vB_AmeM_PT11-V22 TaxID=2704031 RepID=A0A6C0R0L5_9CAUD|nr:hypothetical protein HWD03_gp106 [Alteromonas phage vB_AmeM_PT11-V22]QHZ59785.1 hypothetical protein [Alteromonas phage vB_AmeM_PT11-V22]